MMHFIPLRVFSCYNHNDRASVIPVSPGRVLVPGLETASELHSGPGRGGVHMYSPRYWDIGKFIRFFFANAKN